MVVLQLPQRGADVGLTSRLQRRTVVFLYSFKQEPPERVCLDADLGAAAVGSRAADERWDTAQRVADELVVAPSAVQEPGQRVALGQVL